MSLTFQMSPRAEDKQVIIQKIQTAQLVFVSLTNVCCKIFGVTDTRSCDEIFVRQQFN